MNSPKIQRALVSVSDKSGLVDFARGLVAAGVEIYSTGGTRRCLEEADVAVRDVSEYTGLPEMMDGRLKTLHPKVAGGILCRHDRADDMAALAQHGIVTFELVVINLYPFEMTVAQPGVTRAEAIEQIDIGGPTLVRAAAKNHQFVTNRHSPGAVRYDFRTGRLRGINDAGTAAATGRRGVCPHGRVRPGDRRLLCLGQVGRGVSAVARRPSHSQGGASLW